MKPTEESTLPQGPFAGKRMRKRHHFAVSAYWFATNLLWGGLLLIIIPAQMKITLWPDDPARMAGLVLGMGSVLAVAVPLIAGPLSDRCTSRWGRRRPYMVCGVAVNLLGLLMLWFAGDRVVLWFYFVAYFIVQAGNNIATGAYSGVIPDVVPEQQHGDASGWMAAMSQMGAAVGIVSAGILMRAGQAGAAYLVIGGSLVIFLAISVVGIRERPRQTPPEPLHWMRFIKSLWIDPRRYADFAWVWLTRALVVTGLWTVQEWMMYYLNDVVGVKESEMEMTAGYVLVTSLIFATASGIVCGRLSDRIGRKRVVYAANAVIALAVLAFLFSPSLGYILIVAAVFGMGYGAYYGVDWALACDVLPAKEDAAKDMAVWHISMTLPQAIALPISGWLLGLFGSWTSQGPSGPVSHYHLAGYVVIFSLAAALLLLGAVLLRNVRGVR
jgi:Na+/melibiose symporter-like transporter